MQRTPSHTIYLHEIRVFRVRIISIFASYLACCRWADLAVVSLDKGARDAARVDCWAVL